MESARSPSTSIAERRQLQEPEKHVIAERAAGGFVRTEVGFADALTRMIEAENAQPGLGFTVYRMRSGPIIGHEALAKPSISVADGTLSRLLESEAVKPGKHGFAYLYLMPHAADVLEQERRLRGKSPLAAAEERIAALQASHARSAQRRLVSAMAFGRRMRVVVLVLLGVVAVCLAVIGGPAFLGAGFVALVVAYEVLRLTLDWSRPGLLDLVEKGAPAWAERKLAGWTSTG